MSHDRLVWLAVAALFGAGELHAQTSVDPVAISFAETRGVEIYMHDQAAWLATDAVGVDALAAAKVAGWVTIPAEQEWLVRFIAGCATGYCVPFDAWVDVRTQKTRVQGHDAPVELPANELAAWRARELALGSRFQACSRRYNTVVVRGGSEGEPRWVVYLLAATDEPSLVVVGGHHRVTVSADGTTIISTEPLSKSCLTIKTNDQTRAIAVSHALAPYPIETDVFTSLSYGLPLYVATSAGSFAVEGSNIRLLNADAAGGKNDEPQ